MTFARFRRLALVLALSTASVHCYDKHVWNLRAEITGPQVPSSPERALSITTSATRAPSVHVEGARDSQSRQDWEIGKPQSFLLPPGASLGYIEIEGECGTQANCGRGGCRLTECKPDASEKVVASSEEVSVWQTLVERREVFPLARRGGGQRLSDLGPDLEVRIEPGLPNVEVEVEVIPSNVPEQRTRATQTCYPREERAHWAGVTCLFGKDMLPPRATAIIARARVYGRCPPGVKVCSPPTVRIEHIAIRD